MTTDKTAISLESKLLKKTDKLAKETGNSRSGVIAIALQKYFHELEQQNILEQLDLVYGNDANSDSEFTEAGKDYFVSNVATESEEW
ncbi:MAG: ribbon-helix-helix domain-containing protein [Cyanobacteria bacterium J06623_7]